eukprot:Lankesteria_metandrocarpae@DN2569_c0_g1_i1.p1
MPRQVKAAQAKAQSKQAVAKRLPGSTDGSDSSSSRAEDSVSSTNGTAAVQRIPATSAKRKASEQQEKVVAVVPTTAAAGSTADNDGVDLSSMTRQQKRMHKEKAKKAERKRLANEAGVELFPKDEVEPERTKRLSTLTARFNTLQPLTDMPVSEILALFPNQRRELDELEKAVTNSVEDPSLRTKRPDGKTTTVTLVTDEITTIMKSGGGLTDDDKTHLQYLSERLCACISWDHYKKFKTALQKLTLDIHERRALNNKIADRARSENQRERVVDRIKSIVTLKNVEREVDAALIVSQTFNLSPEAASVVFTPAVNRRVERCFECAIDPQMSNAPPGQPRVRTRTAVIWGEAQKITACVDFLSNADFSGRTRVALERQSVSALIGRGGSGIRKLEEEYTCFVLINSNNEAVLYGQKDDFQKVIKTINTIREEADRAPQTTVISGLTVYIARALQSLLFAELRTIEADTQTVIRIAIGSPGGSEGQVIIRGVPQQSADAKNRVEVLLSRLTTEEIVAEPRILAKLYGADRVDSPSIASEFVALRDASRVVIAKSDGRVIIIGESADTQLAKVRLQDLVLRASYTAERINIAREQLRIFTADVKREIEVEACVHLNVNRQRDGTTVIQTHLETRAAMQHFEFETDETRMELLRGKGQRIRELESTFAVSLSLSKEKNSHSVLALGPPDAVEKCRAAIEELDRQIKEKEMNTLTKEIQINPSRVAVIIGQRGSTITRIRESSGIDRIDVDGGKLVLKGLAAAIEKAEILISEVLDVDDSGGNVPPTVRKAVDAAPKKSKPEKQHVPDHSSFDTFPSLGTAVEQPKNKSKKRFKNRNQGQNSPTSPAGESPLSRAASPSPAENESGNPVEVAAENESGNPVEVAAAQAPVMSREVDAVECNSVERPVDPLKVMEPLKVEEPLKATNR